MSKRWIAVCAAAVALAIAAPPAGSEVYRCRGQDGTTLYTSDPSQCPGATPHEPRGQLQTHETRPAPQRPAAEPRGAAALLDADAAAETTWRRKKAEAQQRLQVVSQRLGLLRRATGWCNRGDSVYVEDESGIRRDVSCDDIQTKFRRLEQEQADLQHYLDEGLEEECRRAGCLPGWIRD